MSFEPGGTAVVIGASGGVGGAVAQALAADPAFARVVATSRHGRSVEGCEAAAVDLTDEASLAALAERLGEGPPLRLVFVASGILHEGEAVRPEKTVRALDPAALSRLFAVNAAGPLLVAKHLTPLFPKEGRCVFAALSARVGSIADNRLGGWYGYRASKAALNMMLKTLAVELARTRPQAVVLGLHPGTVDTDLSRPFQGGVPANKLFTAQDSARRLLQVVEQARPEQSGGLFAYDGQAIPY